MISVVYPRHTKHPDSTPIMDLSPVLRECLVFFMVVTMVCILPPTVMITPMQPLATSVLSQQRHLPITAFKSLLSLIQGLPVFLSILSHSHSCCCLKKYTQVGLWITSAKYADLQNHRAYIKYTSAACAMTSSDCDGSQLMATSVALAKLRWNCRNHHNKSGSIRLIINIWRCDNHFDC
jgi:hypothetical protein